MADVFWKAKSVNVTDRNPLNPSLFLRPEELRRAADLLFYAHRDFSALGLAALEPFGLGRADHRALQFIGRDPGIHVSALLDILKVRKQSLNRTLRQLGEHGLIETKAGRDDRRQKTLWLTQTGEDLVRSIESEQHARIIEAYRSAGPKAIAAFWDILIHMIEPAERDKIRRKLDLDRISGPT